MARSMTNETAAKPRNSSACGKAGFCIEIPPATARRSGDRAQRGSPEPIATGFAIQTRAGLLDSGLAAARRPGMTHRCLGEPHRLGLALADRLEHLAHNGFGVETGLGVHGGR